MTNRKWSEEEEAVPDSSSKLLERVHISPHLPTSPHISAYLPVVKLLERVQPRRAHRAHEERD